MERILFKKIEAWVVVLIVLVGLVIGVYAASVVMHATIARYYFEGPGKPSKAGDIAFSIASIPDNLRDLLRSGSPLAAADYARFNGRSGWHRYGDAPPISGYLLLNRIDGDSLSAVVELVDLSDFSVKHRWIADPDAMFAGAAHDQERTDYTQWTRERFRTMHPLMMADGSVVIHGQTTPLARIDRCSRRVWMLADTHFHHSLNLDAEGNFWVPTLIDPSPLSKEPLFRDDGLAKVSPEGKLLWTQSVAQILDRHDLTYLVFQSNNYQSEPLHLNDIQPVLQDGPYWKKDDLFVSLRNRSMVMLYRPSTDEIVWMKQGPWLGQHDVDVIDDHTIAVFDNHAENTGSGTFIEPNSDIVFYDFATGQISRPYAQATADAQLMAKTNGLFDLTESGDMIVEEDTSGRLLIFGSDHKLAADFINIAKDGVAYRMGWSRYVPRADGDAALAAMAAQPPCP